MTISTPNQAITKTPTPKESFAVIKKIFELQPNEKAVAHYLRCWHVFGTKESPGFVINLDWYALKESENPPVLRLYNYFQINSLCKGNILLNRAHLVQKRAQSLQGFDEKNLNHFELSKYLKNLLHPPAKDPATPESPPKSTESGRAPKNRKIILTN